jgi:hypothetical protein
MAWWQIALAAWGLGAFATFPLAFEFCQLVGKEDRQPLPGPWAVVACALMAAVWPIAWLTLLIYAAARLAVRHG